MPVPTNRVPVIVARGNKATLDANLSSFKEGELLLALDEDILYAIEGGVLVAVGQAGGGGASTLNELTDVDTTGQAEAGGTANYLRLSGGKYVPSGGNIKEDDTILSSVVGGATAEAARTDTNTGSTFVYADQAAWEAAGYTYIANSGTVASQRFNTDFAITLDPSTVSTDWAEGTYLGVKINSGALWSISASGVLHIANDGVTQSTYRFQGIARSTFRDCDLSMLIMSQPSFAGCGYKEVAAGQWVVSCQHCDVTENGTNQGYQVEYVFNSNGTIRCTAYKVGTGAIPNWQGNTSFQNIRFASDTGSDYAFDDQNFQWDETTSQSWSALIGPQGVPYSLTDFNGIDVTGVLSGDLAKFDSVGNITPGHDQLAKLEDYGPNYPYIKYNLLNRSTSVVEPTPGVFKFFYESSAIGLPPSFLSYQVSGSTLYFNEDGRSAVTNVDYEVINWFNAKAGSGGTLYTSDSLEGPWTARTYTNIVEDVVGEQYRIQGLSSTSGLVNPVATIIFSFDPPQIYRYNDGDVATWDATAGAFYPRGKIDTDDFKALVAASTDFADFQTRVAALTSYRS